MRVTDTAARAAPFALERERVRIAVGQRPLDPIEVALGPADQRRDPVDELSHAEAEVAACRFFDRCVAAARAGRTHLGRAAQGPAAVSLRHTGPARCGVARRSDRRSCSSSPRRALHPPPAAHRTPRPGARRAALPSSHVRRGRDRPAHGQACCLRAQPRHSRSRPHRTRSCRSPSRRSVSSGPSYRFRTEVLGRGRQVGATWQGDLYLKGFGDPDAELVRARPPCRTARSSRHHPYRRPAARRRVVVRREADGARLEVGLLHQRVPAALGARGRPCASTTGTSRCGRRSRRPGGSASSCAGTGSRRGAVGARPRAGRRRPAGAGRVGRRCSAILQEMDRAERQLHGRDAAEGARRGARARAARRPPARRSSGASCAAAGIPLAGVRIVDGSGLSLDDRLTAASARSAPRSRPGAIPSCTRPFWAALPVAGVNGTLKNRLETAPARGAVRAKTGTTDEASALSGLRRQPLRLLGAPERRARSQPARRTRLEDRFATRARAGPLASGRIASSAASSASVRSGTPAFSAFATLVPGLSPTKTAVVFFETLSETFAPSASSAARACSRENRLERPGDHVLPAASAGPRRAGRRRRTRSCSPSARSSATSARCPRRRTTRRSPRPARGRSPRTP